jgi:hypothetical protein
VGLEVVSDSNRQAMTKRFGCMQAIVLKADGEPRRISCHGAFVADEGQARYLPRAQAPLRHFKAESGEGGGLVSCYVTCLRHGHTAWWLGSISRQIYAFHVSRALASQRRVFAGEQRREVKIQPTSPVVLESNGWPPR